MWFAAGPAGLAQLHVTDDELEFVTELDRRFGGESSYSPVAFGDIVSELEEYFGGSRRRFDVRLDLGSLRPFQRRVLEAVHAVPYGETRSYAEIAFAIGTPRAMRAVGTAIATSPISIVVPCHRIIRSDGTMGEYATGSRRSLGRQIKRELLAQEGVRLTGEWVAHSRGVD